jgi:hypothetical protein
VTSSAADIPSVTVDLAPTNGTWSGVIGNIPAGTNRTFLAQAFDSSGTLLFEGSASGITISENQTTLVAIILQQVNAPPPFENEAPLIDSLVASSTSVPAGGSLSLEATAHDPNTGDTLSYAWSATAGSFSSASTPSTTWTAPDSTGIQTLTFTVTDPGGLSSSVSLAVNVITEGEEGEAQLSISFNSAPRVDSLLATPTQLDVGQTTAVSALASDPDGDSLSYAWSATCAGSWAHESSSAAQFTPSALPNGACNNCRLTVSVSDGRGGQNTGTVALCVRPPPPLNHFPPVITRSYRSSDTALPGQVLTFEVAARDPEGSALTFTWAANSGSLGPPAHGVSSSRITWSAPSCVTATTSPTITATVTNAFNLTATRSFAVTGLPVCSHWASTGPMTTPRYLHTATLLPNGKVLVAGGAGEFIRDFATAELYDPASGTWSATGSMTSPRWRHSAILLRNGKVLVAGGTSASRNLATAELYDPATGTWSATGSMSLPRALHTATLLPNGKVLVTGGHDSNILIAEVYDPASGTWSSTGPLAYAHFLSTATLLPNGKVLIAGGKMFTLWLADAELYDPQSNTWSAASSMASARHGHIATLLPNGKVLVVGGSTQNNSSILSSAEVYDPASDTWSPAGSMSSPRFLPTATLLPDGKVLVVGGSNGDNDLTATEVYDPASSTWSDIGPTVSPRNNHTATLLPDAKVLVTGTWDALGGSTAAELYTP